MKKIPILLIMSLLIGAGCEGPVGPPGLDGLPGPQGPQGVAGAEAYVVEYEFSFVAPDYGEFLFYDDVEALPSDVVLVYLLWGEDEDGLEIWRLLPQSQITEFGWLQYNFDFTEDYAYVFMEADFLLDDLGADFTDGWVARVVIVPGGFVDGRSLPVDYSDYNAVKEAYGIPDIPLPEGYEVINRFE